MWSRGFSNAGFSDLPGKIGEYPMIWMIFLSVASGFFAGFITVLAIYVISEDSLHYLAEALPFALLVACVAAPVGAWHGWRVGKWLMKNE